MTRYSSANLRLTRSCPQGFQRRSPVLDPRFRNEFAISKYDKKISYNESYAVPQRDIAYEDDTPHDVHGLEMGPEQMQLIAEELDSMCLPAVLREDDCIGDTAPGTPSGKTAAERATDNPREECSGDGPVVSLSETADVRRRGEPTPDVASTPRPMFQHSHVVDSKSTFARIDRYVNRARIAVGLLLAFFWFATFTLALVEWFLQPPEETIIMMVLRLIQVPFDYVVQQCRIVIEWLSCTPKETFIQRALRTIRMPFNEFGCRTCYRNAKWV